MQPHTKLIILSLVSVGSLFWGILDLMRNRDETTTTTAAANSSISIISRMCCVISS